MAESRKSLVMIAPETGEEENCGVIAHSREVGRFTVWLTYAQFSDEERGLWWIVFRETNGAGKTAKLGYIEERREICWEDYRDLTESKIEHQFTLPDTAS